MQSLLDNSPNLKQLQDFLFMNLLSLYDFLMSLGFEDASSLLLFYENVYVWNIDGATEILQTMCFILNNFLWVDIVPRVKTVKINNVVMLVPLSICNLDETWSECVWSQGETEK